MRKRRPDVSGEVGFSEKQMCVLSDLLDEKWNSALEKAIEEVKKNCIDCDVVAPKLEKLKRGKK